MQTAQQIAAVFYRAPVAPRQHAAGEVSVEGIYGKDGVVRICPATIMVADIAQSVIRVTKSDGEREADFDIPWHAVYLLKYRSRECSPPSQ